MDNRKKYQRNGKKVSFVQDKKKRLAIRMSKLQRHHVANTVYKDFSNIRYKILQSYAVNIICNYQCGCREGKSTTDKIHALRQILKKTREHKIRTYNLRGVVQK